MPSGAKKRKAAKKKKEQAVHQINISTKSNHGNNDHRSENNDHVSKIIEESKIKKEFESEENIEIINHSSPNQEKSSSSSSSSSSSNGSSSDDDIDKEERDLTDANTSFTDPIFKEQIQIENISDPSSVISAVDSVDEEKTDADTPFDHPISKEQIQIENNISDQSSVISVVDSLDEEKSASDEKSVPISDDHIHVSNAVPEGIKESEVPISQEIEVTERSTIGIVRRTSWLNCCGLFEVITGGSTK